MNTAGNSPWISVIIPVYNAEHTLQQMVDSLNKQTFQNFEVILVDDGSTDGSLELCRALAEQSERYAVYTQENQGAYAARNTGLSHVTGEYITFVDADDELDARYLERLLEDIQDADISICDVRVVKQGREVRRFTHATGKISSQQAIEALLERETVNSGPCAKLFRRKLLDGLRFPPLRVYEDVLFVLEAFRRSASVSVVNDVAYYYIQDGESTMSACHKMPSLDIVRATEILMDYVRGNRELDPNCCYTTVSHLFQYAMPLTVSREFQDCEFIRETRRLYRVYLGTIMRCKAMPWKEKLIFGCYAYGIVFSKGKWKRIK